MGAGAQRHRDYCPPPLPFLHGWNLAQTVMAACMLVGIGTGNVVATHSVEFIQATSKVGIAMPAVPDVTRIGAQIRAARIDLLQLQNLMAQRQKDGVAPEDSSVQFSYSVTTASDHTMYLSFGANPPINGYSAVRGQIAIPQVNIVSTDDSDLVTLQNTINASVFNAAIALAQRIDSQYSSLVGLDPTDTSYASRASAVELAVTSIIQDEQNSVQSDIASAVQSANSNVSAASAKFLQQRGWMGVGFILPFVAQRNQEANDAATASTSTASGTAKDKDQPMVTQTVCDTAMEFVSCSDVQVPANSASDSGSASGGMFADFLNALGFNEMISIMKGAADTAQTIFKEGLTKYLNDKITEALNKGGLLGSLTDAVGATGSGGTIATMASIGIKTVKIASTISVTLGAAAVVAGLIPFVSLGASVAAVAAISAPFVAMLFVSGFAMASILPWVPFTLWLGAIASMFVVYAESLIAAPLWALAHLDDSGDGMGQQSKRGYVFTLTLLFGPAVLVIAYTFSTALFEALAGMSNSFISSGLIKMIKGSDGWFTTIIMLIGAIITLFTVNISLVYSCFGLPIKVVQKVFTWIGGDFGANVTPDMEAAGKAAMSKGEGAAHAAHQSHANAIAGAGNVMGAAANDLNRAGGAATNALNSLASRIRGGGSEETAAGTEDAATNSISPSGDDGEGSGGDAGADMADGPSGSGSGPTAGGGAAAVPSGDAAATPGGPASSGSGSSMIVDSKGVPFKLSAPAEASAGTSDVAPSGGGASGGGEVARGAPGGGGPRSAGSGLSGDTASSRGRSAPSGGGGGSSRSASWSGGYNNPSTGPVDAAMGASREAGRALYGRGGAVRAMGSALANVGSAIAGRASSTGGDGPTASAPEPSAGGNEAEAATGDSARAENNTPI